MQCKYKNNGIRCGHQAMPGWTMCMGHHAIGGRKRNDKRKQERQKISRRASLLNWLAGDNKPDALGMTPIDPKRWETMCRIMREANPKRGER